MEIESWKEKEKKIEQTFFHLLFIIHLFCRCFMVCMFHCFFSLFPCSGETVFRFLKKMKRWTCNDNAETQMNSMHSIAMDSVQWMQWNFHCEYLVDDIVSWVRRSIQRILCSYIHRSTRSIKIRVPQMKEIKSMTQWLNQWISFK